jgi:hypothetical protein
MMRDCSEFERSSGSADAVSLTLEWRMMPRAPTKFAREAPSYDPTGMQQEKPLITNVPSGAAQPEAFWYN